MARIHVTHSAEEKEQEDETDRKHGECMKSNQPIWLISF